MATVPFTVRTSGDNKFRRMFADLTAGDITDVGYMIAGSGGSVISVYPASGATVKVWKSTSLHERIAADAAALRLTKTNLEGDQVAAGLQSRWALWATGAVTGAGLCFSEGSVESAGDTAVLAESTGGAARVEVAQ